MKIHHYLNGFICGQLRQFVDGLASGNIDVGINDSSRMNQSLKPKAAFRQTPFAKSMEALVLEPGFRDACQQSLLNYWISLPSTNDSIEAAANWHRLEGALEVIDTLLNIAEIPKAPEPKPNYNLKT